MRHDRSVLPGRRTRPVQRNIEHRPTVAVPRELLERRLARLIAEGSIAADALTVSIPEAGKLLDLSENTAYAAAKRGQIPYRQFGKKKRVFIDALLALAATTDRPAEPGQGVAS